MSGVDHRSHKGLNNRAEHSHQPTRQREWGMKRFKSPGQLQRFVSIHDPIANLFSLPRHEMTSSDFREMRSLAMATCTESLKFEPHDTVVSALSPPDQIKLTVPLRVQGVRGWPKPVWEEAGAFARQGGPYSKLFVLG